MLLPSAFTVAWDSKEGITSDSSRLMMGDSLARAGAGGKEEAFKSSIEVSTIEGGTTLLVIALTAAWAGIHRIGEINQRFSSNQKEINIIHLCQVVKKLRGNDCQRYNSNSMCQNQSHDWTINCNLHFRISFFTIQRGCTIQGGIYTFHNSKTITCTTQMRGVCTRRIITFHDNRKINSPSKEFAYRSFSRRRNKGVGSRVPI
ncbi:hypothetical protein AMTR_s00139p00094130 [Amborella trichopoda]|uniref:Uncharacterized protein n=1 Tax=Amborella trichopoda TaxID=13333 RepID=W1NFA5_AMBTC|nr:hypothetical protein AMTR_s00139p00094130 [Amborella trichopoda]